MSVLAIRTPVVVSRVKILLASLKKGKGGKLRGNGTYNTSTTCHNDFIIEHYLATSTKSKWPPLQDIPLRIFFSEPYQVEPYS